jgi:hypothetical protein
MKAYSGPVRCLEKAGALVAAELDRLLRKESCDANPATEAKRRELAELEERASKLREELGDGD